MEIISVDRLHLFVNITANAILSTLTRYNELVMPINCTSLDNANMIDDNWVGLF